MSLIRRAALLLILALSAGGAAAECRGPSLLEGLDAAKRAGLAAAASATPHGQGILWSARRGGSQVLLLGTMHMPDPRHATLLAHLLPVIQGADLVLLEATPSEESAMAQALAASPSLAALGEGPALPDRLGPEVWALVADAAAARGLAPEAAARLSPWLLMMALSAPPCALAGLGPGDLGLDRLVMRAAQGAAVPVAALEPWDTLFRLFGEAGEARQIELLKLSLLPPAAAEGMLVAMREGYFAGRTAEMWELARLGPDFLPPALASADRSAWGTLEAGLLEGRNADWLPVIEAAATERSRLLVAAGASHLPGEAGLLRLLEQDGWALEPLDPAHCCEGVWETP